MYIEKLKYKGNYLRADDYHDIPLKVNTSALPQPKADMLRLGHHKDVIAMDKIEILLQLAFAFYKKTAKSKRAKEL